MGNDESVTVYRREYCGKVEPGDYRLNTAYEAAFMMIARQDQEGVYEFDIPYPHTMGTYSYRVTVEREFTPANSELDTMIAAGE